MSCFQKKFECPNFRIVVTVRGTLDVGMESLRTKHLVYDDDDDDDWDEEEIQLFWIKRELLTQDGVRKGVITRAEGEFDGQNYYTETVGILFTEGVRIVARRVK